MKRLTSVLAPAFALLRGPHAVEAQQAGERFSIVPTFPSSSRRSSSWRSP
jgi:hypothetical protein